MAAVVVLSTLALTGAGCAENGGTWLSSDNFDFLESEPPELIVVSIAPPNNEQNVSPEAIIDLRFSQPIKSDSVNPEGITLSYINPDLAEAELEIHYEWFLLDGEKVLQIKPIGNLLSGEMVEFVLSCDI
ncbi:Ig-like domain-containing protein, partial [Patescibacteria group bacterium]